MGEKSCWTSSLFDGSVGGEEAGGANGLHEPEDLNPDLAKRFHDFEFDLYVDL